MARYKVGSNAPRNKAPNKNASIRRASQRVKDAGKAGFKTTSKFTESVRAGKTARPSSGSTDISQGTVRETARNIQGGQNKLTSDSLRRAGQIQLPQQAVTPVGDVSANLAGLTGGDSTLSVSDGQLITSPIATARQTFLDNTASNTLPNGADIQAKLEKESGLRAFQQRENQLSGQINTIIANRDAAKLKIEGQGRGITDTIIGGQQARIDKEAAIKALPVQALLAEAQGNVALAKDHINTWGRILMSDATNAYNQKNALYKSALDFATADEARRLQVLDRDNNRAYADKRSNIGLLNDWAKTAIEYGQSSVAGSFMRLDPTSTTFREDFASLQGQVRKPVKATAGGKAPVIKKINGVDMQWSPATQSWVDPRTGGEAPLNVQQLASGQANIDVITSVLDSPALDSTVGTSFLTRSGKGFFGTVGRVASLVGIPTVIGGAVDQLTGEKQNLIGDIKQLQSQLSLDSLVNAKANGATFGALSEKELQLLSNSATKLSSWEIEKDGNTIGYDASEKDFKAEMDKINRFAKLDYLLKGGSPEDIGVVTKDDNTFWAQNSNGTYTQLQ